MVDYCFTKTDIVTVQVKSAKNSYIKLVKLIIYCIDNDRTSLDHIYKSKMTGRLTSKYSI